MLDVRGLDADKSFSKNNTQETFKDQVFPLPAPQLKFKIYFLRRAHTFLERRIFDGQEEERGGSTLETCWQRQIWDDRGF